MPFDNLSESLHPLIVSLERRDRLSQRERDALEALPWRMRYFEPGQEIVRQNSRPTESCVLLDGLAARVKHSSEGGSQITSLYVAGNFVDLHGFILKEIDDAITAVSACRATVVPHAALLDLIAAFPHLARLLWTLTEVDAAILRTWIFQLGRRSAVQRLAHLTCEMFCRLETVGMTQEWSFDFPVNQYVLSSMLGLSSVHTNRSLQELRASGSVTWRQSRVKIVDWNALSAFAEFDPTYLHLNREQR